MKKRITKEVFMKIFSDMEYRKKLDKMVLNFFGLENNYKENNEIQKSDTILEFILLINTELTLKIIVKDTQNLFENSKKFYINLSYREVERHHELLMPCYWEIYCPYAYKHIKKNPKLLLVAALLNCYNDKEIKEILDKMEVFTKNEINHILKIIEEENSIIYKDK